jgi:alpha-beta hydrolase superfamily lysophospholipase
MKHLIALVLILLTPQLLRAEPITLDIPTGKLYGTLEVPKSGAPCPVALIISGSGPTNRDGDSLSLGGESDCLRLLAEGLLANGIASVRYDKRGIAVSAPAFPNEVDLRFENYIDDAVLWGKKLLNDGRFSSLIVIGHSEGALVGMSAAKTLQASAFISVAGAGRVTSQLILDQLKAQSPPPDLLKSCKAIVQSLTEGKTTEVVPAAVNDLFRPSMQPYLISLYRHDPVKKIGALQMPILIAQGTTDLQVNVQDAQMLTKANPRAKLCIIEGMNHVLKSASGDVGKQLWSYIDPALPVTPQLIDETSKFINGLKSVAKAN